MNIVDRFKAYINYLGLQNAQVADMAGIPRPTLSQLLTGRNKKISNELIEKIHVAFPTLSILWLLFGEGEMLVKANIETSAAQNSTISTKSDDVNTDYKEFREPDLFSEDFHSDLAEKSNVQNMSPSLDKPEVPTQSNQSINSIIVFYSDNSYEIFEPKHKKIH